MGSRSSYRFVGAALAKLGYPTVLPDYRLYPARFPAYVEDGARAVVWAQQHAREFGADPKRVVLVGHSAGAWLAALLALDPQYLRAAGGDPATIAGFIGPFRPLTRCSPPRSRSPRRSQRRTQRRSGNRCSSRAQGDPPALLVHGLDDDVVYPSHTQRPRRRARRRRRAGEAAAVSGPRSRRYGRHAVGARAQPPAAACRDRRVPEKRPCAERYFRRFDSASQFEFVHRLHLSPTNMAAALRSPLNW